VAAAGVAAAGVAAAGVAAAGVAAAGVAAAGVAAAGVAAAGVAAAGVAAAGAGLAGARARLALYSFCTRVLSAATSPYSWMGWKISWFAVESPLQYTPGLYVITPAPPCTGIAF